MNKTGPKLTHAQKVEVVMRLGCYDKPAAIAKRLKHDFGIDISWQSIARYDPTRYAGRAVSERWTTLFWDARARIIAGKADVGATHPLARVRWLEQMVHDRMDEGNTAEARALLKQVAEEMNRMAGHSDRESGRPFEKLSDAELAARLGALRTRLDDVEAPGGRAAAIRGGVAAEPDSPGEPVPG